VIEIIGIAGHYFQSIHVMDIGSFLLSNPEINMSIEHSDANN
jgi:hypothetical protein